MAVSGEFMVTLGIVVGAGAISADLPRVLVLPANVEFMVKTRCGGAGALQSEVFPGLRNCSAQRFQGVSVTGLTNFENVSYAAPNLLRGAAEHAAFNAKGSFGVVETAGLWLLPVVH